MSDNQDNDRRRFLGRCGSMLGLLAAGRPVNANMPLVPFDSVQLVDERGRALSIDAIEPRTEYIFHYPYLTTPCFLIDLGEPAQPDEELETADGARYRWEGGVGPGRSIVAFSAICSHRLSHPTPRASFIGYRRDPVGYMDSAFDVQRRPGVIQCCSEQSVYDPTRGARVLGGPAPQPLAAIRLEYGADETLRATGVYGGQMFERYFELFSSRLVLEYETLEVQAPIRDSSVVLRGDVFTRNTISCG